MEGRVLLSELGRKLAAVPGVCTPAPGYGELYQLLVDGELQAGRTNGLWYIAEDQLPSIALRLGLTVLTPAAPVAPLVCDDTACAQRCFDLAVPAKEAMRHLLACLIMFEQIERNRNMPSDTPTRAQYVAKGHEIREFLTRIGFIRDASQ